MIAWHTWDVLKHSRSEVCDFCGFYKADHTYVNCTSTTRHVCPDPVLFEPDPWEAPIWQPLEVLFDRSRFI